MRIADGIIRGELDCTERARVRGWLEFSTRPGRVILDLEGHPGADLAGGRFRIERARPPSRYSAPCDSAALAGVQTGKVGLFTHMEKRRELDAPVEELLRRSRLGEPPPTPWRRAVYLEWLSEENGRVLVEDTRLELRQIGERTFFYSSDELQTIREERVKAEGTVDPETGLEVFMVRNPAVEDDLASTLRLQASAFEGAVRESERVSGDWPAPVTEYQSESGDETRICELFHPPVDLLPREHLVASGVGSETNRLVEMLERDGVTLAVCGHFSAGEVYDWIRVHVLTAFVRSSRLARRKPVEFSTAHYCLDCEIAIEKS
jgi:hypothetical protein